MRQVTIERMVDLLDPAKDVILNMSREEAIERVASGDPAKVREIDGQFALVHKHGNCVRLARSIGRPMRFFLAKQVEGPLLLISDRIDSIYEYLRGEGLEDQFHPSYTRMIPAHHVTELALVGCPDPNPQHQRFLESKRDVLGLNLDEVGHNYMQAVSLEIDRWLNKIDPQAPIGVMFSGGVDSGAIFLLTYDRLLKRGESPSRLKAFTLSIDGGGKDFQQADSFLTNCDLSLFHETIDVASEDLDYAEAIRAIEDYKPLDVQAATMGLALCRGIRERYPDWKYVLDGDGGDENLRDYPIEENPELTIRSVLNNPFFYQEGWGVEAVKHSLVYSGGQSRGHVRSYAPASLHGFQGFSPFATPNVIDVAEGIPFIDLTEWDHDKLYSLKGDITRRGVEAITGITMPVYEKRRFQRGAIDDKGFDEVFPEDPLTYRKTFAAMYE